MHALADAVAGIIPWGAPCRLTLPLSERLVQQTVGMGYRGLPRTPLGHFWRSRLASVSLIMGDTSMATIAPRTAKEGQLVVCDHGVDGVW